MTDPEPDQLRDRYESVLRSEAETLKDASGQTRVDREPVTLDQQSVGRLSRIDAMQQQAMASAQEGRRIARLRAIDAALARIGTEEFGFCQDCGDFIGYKRLDLDATLMRCVDCAG